ncbi:PD40 domain-containing protein [Raineyella fluvialis]|uniref:Novel STAND NTPase 1 domain-containing protein n=1 Tax=Raineyella fluvialis TaxID=2662261 RepID=A0A5Q2FBS5_9ACTN|nr:PD40 domain-containing protein [Raineyella fluvialis]QGF23851.1 hypothetical protein Rai3103_09380 [Raineyella fluvialis]
MSATDVTDEGATTAAGAITGAGLPRTKRGLGEALAAGRSRAGLSYRDLSRRSTVPVATLQGWIGGRSLPTPALRSAFLEVLDLLGLTADHTGPEWWQAVEDARRIPGTAAGNPYVGLRPYAPEDRDVFFGRQQELADLVERVRAAAVPGAGQPVVALLAPSGGGKSSLLGAGLVGTACAPGGALDGWYAALLTPGEDPEERWRAAYAARLAHPELPAVLVIDQCEELWTVASQDRREALIALLGGVLADGVARGEAAGQDSSEAVAPDVVVIGLRSDYFGPAAEHTVLGAALGHPLLLPTVSTEQAESIITGPARLRGVVVDPGLIAVLQRDLGAAGGTWAGGALPLLSQALTETWDTAKGQTLTAADYLAVGGVAGAIERAAERAYADLDEAARPIARGLILRMVRVDLDTPVRRPLELELLQDDEVAWSVVERFARARLLTVGDDTVELAHEALLQHWNRLRGWVAEDMEDLRARAYLARAAALWTEHDRDDDLLIPVGRFGLGLEEDATTRMLGTAEREFVAASRAHFLALEQEQVRTNRRLRLRARVAFGALAGVLVLAILAVVALINMQNTRNQALSRQMALSSSLVSAQDPGLAAQIALGASEWSGTPEGTSALISATGRPFPRRALGPSAATKLTVDADARLLVQPEPDGTLRLWRGQAASGAAGGAPEVLPLDPAHKSLFAGAVSTVGGQALVAAGGMNGLWLVDAAAAPARVLATLSSGPGTTYAAVFSPDGRTLYAGMQNGSIRRWDISTPTAPHEMPALATQQDPVLALTIDPTGTRLATAGAKGVARWVLDGDRATLLGPLTTLSAVQAVAFSPDGQWLAAGESRGRRVSRWRLDGDTATAQAPLTGFTSWINDVHFSSDGARVLVASSDQSMREFDQTTGAQLRSYPHPAVVSAAIYARDHLVSAASDGTVRWWPRVDPVFTHFATGLFQVSADTTGTHLLSSVDRTGSIAAWDLADPSRPRRLPDPETSAPDGSHPAGDYEVVTAVLADGSAVLGGTKQGDVVVWNRRGDAFAPAVSVPVDPGQSISWIGSSADSRTLVASAITSQKALVLRRAGDSFAVTGQIDVDQPQAMGIDATGRLAVVADINAAAGVWTIDDAGRATRVGGMADLGSTGTVVVFSPDGRSVAIGTDSGRVVVYDLADPAHPRQVSGESTALGAIYGMAVSPDGRYLAAGAGDNRIWLWRWDNEKLSPFAWIEASLDRVNDVRFVDNGRRLVAGGANGGIASWDIDVDRARETVCQGRGAPLTADEWAERLVGAAPRELC